MEDEKPRASLARKSEKNQDRRTQSPNLKDDNSDEIIMGELEMGELDSDDGKIEPFGDILLDDIDDVGGSDVQDELDGKEGGKPLLSHDDIASYLSIPKDVRKSKAFKEEIDSHLKLDPQKEYRSHDNFKDFLEFPTIAKDLKKMPTTGYFPKEAIKQGNEKVSVADKINIKSQKGNKVSVIVHRDFNNDIKLLEILTKDGDKILIAFDEASSDSDKTTDYIAEPINSPQGFTLDEIEDTVVKNVVDEEEFKRFAKQNRMDDDDYQTLAQKLKDSDSVSEDL